MDCIPSKIAIQFDIDKSKEVDKNLIDTNNRKLLADIEGSLNISINGNDFFQEDYILLLEFAIAISTWLEKVEKGIFQDFVYETMDYSEGAIIEFNQKNDRTWVVTSIWGNDNIATNLCIQDIIIAVKDFLTTFQKNIYKTYSINLNKFMI
ncbi:hypothetical protein Dtox_2901 [Desulfofarcimen acetoxidans DSM 771]|uniref:DUF7878 domain-containing protein n=1 Tax=Desulfofarcimen acetoxidans (strain ATCC 49208 / DSM 771 / KCTC 5769 / VKM B-1644 / 5575) TaxID=485916 RepID=C8W2H8_DESAS|nr:hypothetical protein [Desulfofarcimen acetoxidans]ACV63662.1 hypothetical protein Dtox_2901 [Desulfofarcimen acetoxidans DSM 771]